MHFVWILPAYFKYYKHVIHYTVINITLTYAHNTQWVQHVITLPSAYLNYAS